MHKYAILMIKLNNKFDSASLNDGIKSHTWDFQWF